MVRKGCDFSLLFYYSLQAGSMKNRQNNKVKVKERKPLKSKKFFFLLFSYIEPAGTMYRSDDFIAL